VLARRKKANMSEALRGTRLGATSLENDRDVEFAPRMTVTYNCPNGHVINMTFSAEAEVPVEWECECGELALLLDATKPEPKPTKHVRTHWDMLLERRSIAELEELLEERLALLETHDEPKRRTA
jgi:hypothetical protein